MSSSDEINSKSLCHVCETDDEPPPAADDVAGEEYTAAGMESVAGTDDNTPGGGAPLGC